MPNQLIFGIGRKRFLVYAIAVVGFGILAASGAKAQTATLTITIIGTGPGPKPAGYRFSSNPNTPAEQRCTFNHGDPVQSSDFRTVRVCPGDKVQWKAETTTASDSGKMRNVMVIFHEHSVLARSGGASRDKIFHSRDGDADGGTPPEDATIEHKLHEYHIFVVDELTNRVYVEDPRIIIGTGGK